jgi:alanine-glyoxylate transaminase/serine-glyoxylate transaminase/serine-pyruvate transaminase
MHGQLWDGLQGLGLKPFVEKPEHRLITVNTIKCVWGGALACMHLPPELGCSLLCLRVPEGVDWAALVKRAMDKYQLEIAGGLGPTVGKVRTCPLEQPALSSVPALLPRPDLPTLLQVWRIGIMGHNARPQNVELVIQAFKDGLAAQGQLKV